jgi:hypothetical protein
MSWLSSIGVGFLTAIIGTFGTGALGLLCVEWFRVPSREGGSGYMVLFMGLLGGVLGFIIGIVGARIVSAGATPGFLKALGVAAGSNLGLLAIATFICWLAADFDTTLQGRPVELQAEVRCPAGFVMPDKVENDKWYTCMSTATRRATSYGELRLVDARQVDGRWILTTTLVLKTSMREKEICFNLGETPHWFHVSFPSKPGSRYFAWSEWLQGIEEVGKPGLALGEDFNLRFRLAILPEPKPEPAGRPSEAEIAAQKQAEENAVLAALTALTPESSLEDCLKFTHSSQPEEFRTRAGAVIGKRSNVVAEMSEQILSADHDISDRALRALAVIKPLPIELAVPVHALGEKLIARMKSYNATKPEDDPNYQQAADVSVLFSEWFHGHHALYNSAGAEGLPQLQVVLDLALVRGDSHVMKNDVARIAQYYVKEWSNAPVAAK